MILKIKFKTQTQFKEEEYYTFKSPSSSQEFKYLGDSRIDGHSVFLFDESENNFQGSIMSFTYNKIEIENIVLVSMLSEHIPNIHYDENKKKIYDFLKEEVGFDDIDLYDEGAYKDIIRRFKLRTLLD